MGPRAFARGDYASKWNKESDTVGFNGAASFRPRRLGWLMDTGYGKDGLQWGRELSPAEISGRARISTAPTRLQWGRELSPAEICLP